MMGKLAQYKSVFNHFDSNGEGKISALELQQCVGGKLLTSEAKAVVEYLDSDRDGLLGFDDFVKFVQGGDEEDLRETFKMYVDMDGRGCITPDSLKRMLSRLGDSTTVDECKVMISRFYLNGDGVLNFDEFKVMMF